MNGLTARSRRYAAYALALLALAVGAVVPVVSFGAAFAAKASVDPVVQYLQDSGTVLTFTVHNTGTTDSIGAVEISRPSTSFTVVACPQAPAGWSTQVADTKCRYRSAMGTADDIAPGASSSSFKLTSATAGGRADFSGTWKVTVSKSNQFDDKSKLAAAPSEAPGLTVKVHSFEILDAVVASAPATPGSACPAASKQSIGGATHVIVICGKNRSTGALTPTAAQSSLAGTFIASPGTFSSGPIAARSSSSRVLGNWAGAQVSGTKGTGKTVIAKVGATNKETSPLTTLGGYEVTNQAPTADGKTVTTAEDTAKTITLSASDADGDAIQFSIVSGPSHGSLGTIGSLTCSLATPNVCTADVLYTPDADYNGPDSFTYKAGDGFSDSAAATVSITVDPVNDAPLASGTSVSVDEDDSVAVGLAALVSDVETAGGDLVYEIVSGPADGDLTGSGGSRSYSPDADFNGADSFTFKVTDRGDPDNCGAPGPACDGPLSSSTETVSITVDPVNDAPLASGTSVSVDEDDSVAVGLAALVSDVETAGGDLVYEIVSGPADGDLTGSGGSRSYSPDADFNGADSFTFKVTDRGDPDNCGAPGPACDGPLSSSTETVSITVDPVNDAPLASGTSVSVDEDDSVAVGLAALVSDVETADGDLVYEIVSGPADGDLTGSGGSRSYSPDADFNGADSFTFKVTDRGDPDNCGAPGPACDGPLSSSTETVSITVDPVNDAPLASGTSVSVDEDDSVAVGLAALVSDVETAGGDLVYEIVSGPADGDLTGSGGSRSYSPDADFNGADSFTFKVTDRGDPDNCGAPGPACDGPLSSSTETVSITVDPVNDAPVIVLPAGPVTAVQDTDTPIAGISVTDVDAGGDDVALELSVDHGTLTVDTTVLGGIGALQVVGNGTATVQIAASLAQISTTLASASGLVYRSDAAFTGADTLTAAVSDLGHNGSGGPRTDSDSLAIDVIPPNVAPVANAQSVSTNEDMSVTITLSASDADGDPLSFAIASAPSHGTLDTIIPLGCCTASVLYTPDADYFGPDSFTFTANDGTVDSAAATVSITVAAVNDPPVPAGIEAGALAYTENDPATLITASTTVADVDSPNFDSGTLTVDYSVGGTADDRLEIRDEGTGAGQIGVSGGNVTFGGTTIGTFTGGTGATPLVVTFNASATVTAVQSLVRNITYRNVSENPSTAARTARFVVTDGDGGTSAPATRAIALSAVNDVPVLAGIEAGALAYTENDPATAVSSSITVADPDSNITGATITISANLAAAQDELGFVDQLGITGGYNAATGVLTLTGSASPADYQTALRAVTYRNTSEDPSTLTRSVSFRVQDGPNPANLSNTVSRDVTVTAVNDAPVADDETFNAANGAIGNTTFVMNDPSDGAPSTPDPTDTSPVTDRPHKTISGDILAGDTDVDGPGPLTITPGTFASNDGGSVTLQADGDFTFEPAASTSCTDASDFFDYTVEDSGSPEQTDTGRVTIAISGCVWYVNNDDAQGNSGTSERPFDTLAQAETASAAGHTIFVYDGNDTSAGYAAGISLKASQKLIGEAAALVVGADTLHGADAANKPSITDNGADVVELDDGNEVRGFNIDPQGAGGGIAGASGDTGGGTIDDVNIVDGGTAGSQPGLELDSTTGTFNVSNLTVSSSGATGVRLNGAGTVSFAAAGTVSIASAGARGLDATGTSMGASTFDSVTVTGSGGGGVSLTSTTGTTTFGDLSLTTTSGGTAAFGLSNAGSVSVPAAGTANVSATGGPAVDVTRYGRRDARVRRGQLDQQRQRRGQHRRARGGHVQRGERFDRRRGRVRV